jgi:small glutamine-rich tetratricopeptide repeat-containing protein alpha
VQCIGEAFGVNPEDKSQYERLTVKPATLQNIFDVYLKTRAKISVTPSAQTKPPAEDKAKAEELKQEGNKHMTAKKYDQAIDSYTKAIALDGTNVIYYSNRAAAYTSKGDHVSAIGDAEKAIEIDPKFVKAYSRLGSVSLFPSYGFLLIQGFPQTLSLLDGRLQIRRFSVPERPRIRSK